MTPLDLAPLTRRALADLDAAPPAPLSAAERARADATLARILASDPGSTGPSPVTSRRRTGRRLVGAAAFAAACTTGVVALQLAAGGESAVASWTAAPHRPSDAQTVAATEACRDALGGSGDGAEEAQVRSASVVLAERRGASTLVLLAGPDRFEASCLTHDGPLFTGGTIGSMGRPLLPTPGARQVLVTSAGTAVVDDEPVGLLAGPVGGDVTGLTVHTATRGDVVATVQRGHVAAWWPGNPATAPDDAPVRATLTYRDGSTWTGLLGMGLGGQPE